MTLSTELGVLFMTEFGDNGINQSGNNFAGRETEFGDNFAQIQRLSRNLVMRKPWRRSKLLPNQGF